MPLDRNKIVRYQVLDRCFRDTSRLYRVADLLECCNRELQRYDFRTVAKRTIQNDIQMLCMEPYNVEFDETLKESNCYRYADTTQSLKVLKLIDPNRDALLQTIDSLRDIYNDPDNQNPQWQWMLLTLQALADNRPINANEEYVSFENNAAYSGNIHFAPLLESIINQHPVTIRYKPYQRHAASEWNIYPYFLKQYNSRWFLFARIDGKEELTNFALDRIYEIKLWSHPFVPSGIDFTSYFDDAIGPTVNDNMVVETVTVKIAASRYPYVETKPFSEKQRILKHDDKTYTISFPVKVNNEFIAKLLSFGSDLAVIHPEHLRQRVAETVEQMHNQYKAAKERMENQIEE